MLGPNMVHEEEDGPAPAPINECTCSNGSGSKGTACSANGAATCAACSDGFYLTSTDECHTNECTCDNGDGSTGSGDGRGVRDPA